MLRHLTGRVYETGDEIAVGNRTYKIIVKQEERSTMACQLKNGTIIMKLPLQVNEELLPYNMKRLLSHAVGKDYLAEITERVYALNQQFFKEKIRQVRLNYNTSNWGSCSNNGVITLSTRLLFAPSRAIDYVIIHELAHLQVFDHSPKFWAVVRKVMPNYQEQERWLKENYFECDFP